MNVAGGIWLSLAVLSLLTVVARRPWTIAVARRSTPKEVWDLPVFHETNMVMTSAWAALFGIGGLIALVTPRWTSALVGVAAAGLGAVSPKVGQRYAMWRLTRSG